MPEDFVPDVKRKAVLMTITKSPSGSAHSGNQLRLFPVDDCRRYGGYWRKTMKISAVIAVSLVAAFVTPALAADSYYIVQDAKTKKCTVTETRPTSAETTVVSGDTVYKTKSEAESGIKTTKVCTTK
jgi:hypothetical protein